MAQGTYEVLCLSKTTKIHIWTYQLVTTILKSDPMPRHIDQLCYLWYFSLMTDRKLSIFEVRPAAEWLVGQGSDIQEHQFGRFFGGLGSALGIGEPEFSETFRRAKDLSTDQPSPKPFFMHIDVLRLDPSQFIHMGALAGHDGFELIPVPEEQ